MLTSMYDVKLVLHAIEAAERFALHDSISVREDLDEALLRHCAVHVRCWKIGVSVRANRPQR